MSIIDYDGISKDTRVTSPNVYMGNGQNCGTVWFFTVAQARQAYKNNDDREPDGRDAGLCEQCACYYSGRSKQAKKLESFKCRAWKDYWAKNLTSPPKEAEG